MRVQENDKEEPAVVGTFGAAAAAQDDKVSSLHKKCIELALLPKTVFGAHKNAAARRSYALKQKQKQSA